METVYWICLLAGGFFGLLSLLFADGLGELLDGLLEGISPGGVEFLHPMTLLGGATVFGASGLMIQRLTDADPVATIGYSALAAMVFATLAFFAYVRPMRRAESSIGWSRQELVGRTALVSIGIPPRGCGEVRVAIGPTTVYELAEADDRSTPLAEGTTVIIVDVRDNTLIVSQFE